MIYITGDVHANIPDSWEQKKAGSEIKAMKKFLEILKKYNLCCTLFINGRCLDESYDLIKELLKYDVELGGHTYNNFGSMNIIKSYLFRKKYSCVYGPSFYQKKDIKKTRKTFERRGLKMNSWRTHAFGSNNKTFEILSKNKVRYVSDLLGDKKAFEKNNLIHVPINIPVDINTISVGPLRCENRDVFASCTKGRINPEEWFEIIKKRVTQNEKNKKDSVLLIHPITMAVLDDFGLFENIAKFLSKYNSAKISGLKVEN